MRVPGFTLLALFFCAACAPKPDPFLTKAAMPAAPAVLETEPLQTNALSPEAAEMSAALDQLAQNQAVMSQLLLVMMQEMTRPELISALKQSAERMEAATAGLTSPSY